MKIAFATLTLDPLGAPLLDLRAGSSSLGDTARRVSRIATLDGGASLLDGGYSVADRTLNLDLTGQTREVVETLRYLCEQYPLLIALTEEGAYLVAPERVSIATNTARMTLLVSGVAEIKSGD